MGDKMTTMSDDDRIAQLDIIKRRIAVAGSHSTNPTEPSDDGGPVEAIEGLDVTHTLKSNPKSNPKSRPSQRHEQLALDACLADLKLLLADRAARNKEQRDQRETLTWLFASICMSFASGLLGSIGGALLVLWLLTAR